jgi:hypothetical protein
MMYTRSIRYTGTIGDVQNGFVKLYRTRTNGKIAFEVRLFLYFDYSMLSRVSHEYQHAST